MNLLTLNDRPGLYPPSWYAATAQNPGPFDPLDGETRADVCVIGAGFTGLSAALDLARGGLKVIVLEASRVGFGASGRNGGQAGSGHRLSQRELVKLVGAEDALKLWTVAEDGKTLLRQRVTDHAPESLYTPGIVHAMWSAAGVQDEHDEADFLATEYGYDQVEKLDEARLQAHVISHRFKGGVIDRGAGHIHPLRYAFGLVRACLEAGVTICEMTEVDRISGADRLIVQTSQGRVAASHVVLACNAYLGGLNRQVAARVMPINSFMAATEPLGLRRAGVLPGEAAVADSKWVVNYFRMSEDNRLLFGGSEGYGYRFPRDIAAQVRVPLEEVFPQLKDVKIDYAWGGSLAITMSRLPYLARPQPNIWSASGFSGHGVVLSGITGRLIAKAILGETEGFDLFARIPSRRFPGGPALAAPLLRLAMTWYALRDRLGA